MRESIREFDLSCLNKAYLDSKMLTQFYCCERHRRALQIKNTLEIKKQRVTQC